MEELGVEVIHAHSAPAKGRVENMFKTFQDRLIKEMRLANIKTLGEANKFLESFLVKHNKRFRVLAKNPANLHRKKPAKDVLEAILCTEEERSLRKNIIRHLPCRYAPIAEKLGLILHIRQLFSLSTPQRKCLR